MNIMKKQKKFFVIFFTFCCIVCFICPCSRAQFSQEGTSTIEQENNLIKQRISSLGKEVATLDQQKKKLEKDFEKIKSAVEAQKSQNNLLIQQRLSQEAASKEKQERLRMEGIQISKEIMELEKEAQYQKGQEVLLFNEVNAARQEVDLLKKQAGLLENSNWDSEKKALRNSLNDSEQKIKSLQRELVQFQKKYQKPLATLEELKRDHFLLEQQVVVSKNALENSLKEKQQQQVILGQLDRKNQLQVLKLTEDITRLKVEKKRMEGVLFQAKEKMNASQGEILSAEEWQKEIERLNKVLGVLNDEKNQLEGQAKRVQSLSQ